LAVKLSAIDLLVIKGLSGGISAGVCKRGRGWEWKTVGVSGQFGNHHEAEEIAALPGGAVAIDPSFVKLNSTGARGTYRPGPCQTRRA
jgi:hypothetical protein